MLKGYKYEDSVLKRLQKTELEMLKIFDDICQKYNIDYFISFGTAIGAVRHGGFIPWDDDIDVCMMREEYEKLRTVPKEEWGDCFLCDPSDDCKHHVKIFPKIYKNNTCFVTSYRQNDYYGRNKEFPSPIWLDIFVMDRVKDINEVIEKSKNVEKYKNLYLYSKCRYKLPKGNKSIRFDRYILIILTNKILSLSKKSSNKIFSLYKKYILSSKDGQYVTSYDFEYPEEMVDFCCKYDDMFPAQRIKFENIEVNIQKNYHESLTKLYGDYMQLPPEEKRFNHPPIILDFGEGDVMQR